MGIFDFYKNMSYQKVNDTLAKHFFYYVLLFIGFMFMCASFIYKQENTFIIVIFLCPLVYFLIKTIYSLILLLDSYKLIHHSLIREYYLLFVIGYNIILLSLDENYIIYYFQSIFLILVSLFLKNSQKLYFVLSLILSTIVFTLYISLYLPVDLLYIGLTLIIVNLFLIPLVYLNNAKIDEEIVYLEKCIKTNPNGLIK